ncbi:CopG family ribbon-helix-helix protein [Reyranella sp.]|uniref:CopG family ribbon-helix-helix protein n=1 Tax=Reyranella sp. TaxID=1929291 RepID=UPI0037844825
MTDIDIRVRVPADLKDRLDALARSTKRSLSDLATDALRTLTDQEESDIAHIRRAMEESRQPNARIVPHKQAMDWIRSRGTSTPLPKPKGRRRTPA